MRLYIAGPMRGYEQFNFGSFDKARDLLHSLGIDAISPADLDREEGFDPNSDGYDFDMHAAMRRDIAAIVGAETDGICLLGGWERSQGVAVERTVNQAVGGLEFYVIYDRNRLVGIEGEGR